MITYEQILAKDLDIELFKIADPSIEQINKYKNKSIAIVAKNKENNIIAFISIHRSFVTGFEINNLLVFDKYQGQGIAKELIKRAEKIVRKQNAKYLEVCTGNSSLSALAVYQKCGLRIVGVHRDYFKTRYTEKIFENGIECLDLIRLRKELL